MSAFSNTKQAGAILSLCTYGHKVNVVSFRLEDRTQPEHNQTSSERSNIPLFYTFMNVLCIFLPRHLLCLTPGQHIQNKMYISHLILCMHKHHSYRALITLPPLASRINPENFLISFSRNLYLRIFAEASTFCL